MDNKAKNVPSSAEAIYESERSYFDHKARQYREENVNGDWLINPADHMSTLKMWGLDKGLSGKRILECGCGTGFFPVLLAKMKAEVWCFDLSPKSIELTIERARLNGVSGKVRAKVASFDNLGYEDESFDLVVGKNTLHHLPDIREAGVHIKRVLKKGGKAIFYELSANNPLLIFIRNHIIGKNRFIPKLGTPNEHPLTKDEVETLSAVFNNQCKISYPKFRFFGKFDRQVLKQRYRFISFILNGIDKMIYILFPPLRKYSYKILLEFTK